MPPLTSTLLGSVEKSRSGVAAGVLNATRQTGSVLGVALFGSLVGQADAFMAGAHAALIGEPSARGGGGNPARRFKPGVTLIGEGLIGKPREIRP